MSENNENSDHADSSNTVKVARTVLWSRSLCYSRGIVSRYYGDFGVSGFESRFIELEGRVGIGF